MLQVDGLTVIGLTPVSFEVEKGECVTVAGPSGSGKTLLLRAIADLDPAAGTVTLDGTERNGMTAPCWRSLVTYVPAVSGWWRATVSQNFADWENVGPMIEALRLPPECGAWPVSRLSTGEQQRLALTRSMCRSPRVLLLDEPTSALDAPDTETVERTIEEFCSSGGGVIWVSHDAEQRQRVSGRTLIIVGGTLREQSA